MAQRKKILEKNTPDEPQVGSTKTYCCKCGMAYSRKKGYFAVSHSPMYRGSGYIPICNECVEKMYETYCKELGPKEAMRRICMKLDLYWSEQIYAAMEKTVGVNSRVRNYIGKTNLVKYIDKTFDDTIKEESSSYGSQAIGAIMDTNRYSQDTGSADELVMIPEIDPDIVEFWGAEFSPEFIIKLDKRYKRWTKDLEDLDNGSIALYKQICIQEEVINRETAAGRAADKNVSMLNTLLGSVNEKPVQKKSDTLDASVEGTTFGEWIRKWENQRPIPDPDPEMQDVDGIVRYISVFFFGHLCKMLGIKNTYCKLYEDEIAKLRVERPEFDGEDDETLFNDVYASRDDGDDY